MRPRSETTTIAQRLLASLSDPSALGGATARIGASIGISFAGVANPDLDDITAAADSALDAAKRSGRSTYRLAKDASPLRSIARYHALTIASHAHNGRDSF